MQILIIALLAAVTWSCGDPCLGVFCQAKKEKTPAPVALLSADGGEDGGRISLAIAQQNFCRFDADRGLFVGKFTNDANPDWNKSFVNLHESLEFTIKDFRLEAASYSCAQAVSNIEDEDFSGDRFDGCMVRANMSGNSYQMYRESGAVPRFAFADNCAVRIVGITANFVQGEIECQNLAQTKKDNRAIYPLSDENYAPLFQANLLGSFQCAFGPDREFFAKQKETSKYLPIQGVVNLTRTVSSKRKVLFDENFRDENNCILDSDSGLLRAELQNDFGSFNLAIRDFTTGKQTHSCLQAANNKDQLGDLGDLYENCFVTAVFADGKTSKDFAYSMYRNDLDLGPFSYEDECWIQTDSHDNYLEISVSCKNMAQTYFAGAPRNPIAQDLVHADEKADLKAKMQCLINPSTSKSKQKD